MEPIVGKEGSVVIGSNVVANIDNWSLDLSYDEIETTSFDSGGKKEFLAGLTEWSGSFEGGFTPGDTNGQKALLAAWANGTSVSLVLKASDTVSFAGSAFIKPSIEVPVGDKASFSCDFRGTGELTIPS